MDKSVLIANAKSIISQEGSCVDVPCPNCPISTECIKINNNEGMRDDAFFKAMIDAAKNWLSENDTPDLEQEVQDELNTKRKVMIDKVILERVKALLRKVHEASYEDGMEQSAMVCEGFDPDTPDQSWERLGHGDLLKELEADE